MITGSCDSHQSSYLKPQFSLILVEDSFNEVKNSGVKEETLYMSYYYHNWSTQLSFLSNLFINIPRIVSRTVYNR